MNIVYSFDNNYCDVVATSMVSLLRNNPNEDITIYVMGINVSEKNIRLLREMSQSYGGKLVYFEVDKDLDKYRALGRKASVTTYGRLFAGKYLPENVNRAIYLDGDTLITGSIKKLQTCNMEEYATAGCCDIFLPPMRVRKYIDFKRDELYINAGVLILNLDRWRRDNIEQKCHKFLLDTPKVILNDQDAINVICRGHIRKIPIKYNMMFLSTVMPYEDAHIIMEQGASRYCSKKEYEASQREPAIIHFASEIFGKPWIKNSCMPYKNEYLRYRSMTPWAGTGMKERVYSWNKVIGEYKKCAEGILKIPYKKRKYRTVAILYKLLYMDFHKIQGWTDYIKKEFF